MNLSYIVYALLTQFCPNIPKYVPLGSSPTVSIMYTYFYIIKHDLVKKSMNYYVTLNHICGGNINITLMELNDR